jgi:hypothetical protein
MPLYDNILQIQIIWITTTAKIEDNITGQKQCYWLEYKSQFCIIFIFKHKYGNVYTRSLSSDVYGIRIANILHARLRQKCSSLKCDLFRGNLIASCNCDCGNYIESVDQFFLKCNIYTEHRIQLFRGYNIYL